MGFFKSLKNLFAQNRQANIIKVYVQDKKCGQKIEVILRKGYDIQGNFEDDKEKAYSLKKYIICDKCFNKIMIEMDFNNNYSVVSKRIEGGKYINEEQYRG